MFIESVLKPKETFAAQKSKASIGSAVKNYAIAGLIMGVIYFVLALTSTLASGNIMAGVTGGVILLIGVPVFLGFFAIIGTGFIFVIAKLLGGNGSYTSLLYLNSLYSPLIYFLSLIPFVGFLASIYSVYLFFLSVKESQELNSGRAAIVVAIPIILTVIIAVLIAMVFVLRTIPASSR